MAEGVNLVKDIDEKLTIKQLFIKESKYKNLSYLENKYGIEAFVVKDELFDAVCDTVTPSGVIAVLEKPINKPIAGDIILLLDGIKDAGNMGTIIRSAAAKGIDSVVAINCTEVYSPKSVRASMGGVFCVNCIETNSYEDAFNLISNYSIVSLDMGGKCIYGYKRVNKIAITVGNEAHGISKEIYSKSDEIISIPMSKNIESLNAAVSISIAMFLIQ